MSYSDSQKPCFKRRRTLTKLNAQDSIRASLKKLFFIVVVLTCFTSSNASAQRFIQGVSVTFNSTSDDKDWDSWIRFQLQSANGSWLGTREGTFGTFPNNSSYTFWLNLGGNYPDYLLTNSYLYLLFIPNGNDTWNFNWSVRVNFSDGTYTTAYGAAGVNESSREVRLRIF